jgi:hypothetical protein
MQLHRSSTKARPALLNDILQRRKLGDDKVSARGNWDAEKEDFEKEWGRAACLLGLGVERMVSDEKV